MNTGNVIHGALKRGNEVIFPDVLLASVRVQAGEQETRGGTFYTPGVDIFEPGEGYRLYLPDGRWAEIAVVDWRSDLRIATFTLQSDWQVSAGEE